MIDIRDAVMGDRERLVELMDVCAPEMAFNADLPRSTAKLHQHTDVIMDPSRTVLVVGTIDGIVGGASFGYLGEHFGTDIPFMLGTSVSIFPQYRGSSLAVRLLDALHKKARKLGCTSAATYMADRRDEVMDRLLRNSGYTVAGKAYRCEL